MQMPRGTDDDGNERPLRSPRTNLPMMNVLTPNHAMKACMSTWFEHYPDLRLKRARMDFVDYRALIEETPVESTVFEFRDSDECLVAACLVDRVESGLSAVYSYFDPDLSSQSLGTYIILWLIERAKHVDLPYVYLGFWVSECDKMSYKAKFQPLERYTPSGWELMSESPK